VSSVSQREILNVKARTQSSYRMLEYIRNHSPTHDALIESFSLGDSELTEHSLMFLKLLGLVKGEDRIVSTVKVKDEYDFKSQVIQAIYKHPDLLVNYLGQVIRRIYACGRDLNEGDMLAILRDVRRKAGLSDETVKDTGKLDNLKPMLTYLGILGKHVVGNRVTYHQCLDPLVLHKLFTIFLGRQDIIQLAEFLEWVDENHLPALESGRPYEALVRSLKSAENMSLIKMDNPSDFRKRVTIGDREISRVVVLK